MANSILIDAFKLAPADAVKYFESKGYKITGSYDEMDARAHATAFTVAGVAKMDILQDMKGLLDKTLKEGMTQKEFADTITPALIKKGWWGSKKIETPEGDIVQQMGSPWRLKTIYQTNILTAYSVGRYKRQIENAESAPFWRYMAVMDGSTRPAHQKLHNLVFRYDDPFWNVFYPPNGYNCRCSVQALTESALERKKLDVSQSDGNLSGSGFIDPKTNTLVTPSEGWDHNPGQTAYAIDEVGAETAAAAPSDLRTAFIDEMTASIEKGEAFSAWIDQVALTDKPTGETRIVSWITSEIENKLFKLGNPPASPIIVTSDRNIAHALRDEKQAAGKALSVDEVKSIPQAIGRSEEVYYDEQSPALLYVFDSSDQKKNKVVVRVNYNPKTKKKAPVNWLITAGKVLPSNLKDPRYKRLK
jgi:SPP1 gp7 family putative phage head morphogenesis protein